MEKKKMKLWKKIVITILIIIGIVLLITLGKFIILTKLKNIAQDKISITNFYAEVYVYSNGNLSKRTAYNKDGENLTTIEFYGKGINGERKIVLYSDETENLGLITSGENKVAVESQELLGEFKDIYSYASLDYGPMQRFLCAACSIITTEEVNSKDCYVININKNKTYVEKST